MKKTILASTLAAATAIATPAMAEEHDEMRAEELRIAFDLQQSCTGNDVQNIWRALDCLESNVEGLKDIAAAGFFEVKDRLDTTSVTFPALSMLKYECYRSLDQVDNFLHAFNRQAARAERNGNARPAMTEFFTDYKESTLETLNHCVKGIRDILNADNRAGIPYELYVNRGALGAVASSMEWIENHSAFGIE